MGLAAVYIFRCKWNSAANRRHLRAARKISLRNSGPAVSVPGPFVTLTLQREAKEQRVFRQ